MNRTKSDKTDELELDQADSKADGEVQDSQLNVLEKLLKASAEGDQGTTEDLLEDSDLVLSRAKYGEADAEAAEEDNEDGSRSRSISGIIGGILGIIRLPEKWLANTYKGSRAQQRMRDTFEWYKNAEDNRSMEKTLESTYGGPSTARFRLKRFLSTNILFTVIILVATIYLARIGVANIFNYDVARIFDHKVFQLGNFRDTPEPKPEKESEAGQQTQEVLADAERSQIEQALNHCSVSDQARDLLRTSLILTPSVSGQNRTQALQELQQFQGKYETLTVEGFSYSTDKRAMLVAFAQPALREISEKLAYLYASRSKLEQQVRSAESQLEPLREAAKSPKMKEINELIRVRGEVNKLRLAMNKMPTLSEIRDLQTELAVLQSRLNSPQSGPATTPDRRWFADIPRLSKDKFGARIEKTVNEGLLETARGLEDPSRELISLRILKAIDTAQELDGVLAVLDGMGPDALGGISLDQGQANRSISVLLGTADEVWVDHMLCQANQSAEASNN